MPDEIATIRYVHRRALAKLAAPATAPTNPTSEQAYPYQATHASSY